MRSTWASASRSSLPFGCLALLCAFAAATPSAAKVFHSQEEAIGLAFPGADRVEDETYVLSAEQAKRVEELAKAPVESRLVRVWRGLRDGQVQGYAMIDVHTVRTHPEAFMVVLSPEGSVRSVRILAFHEPLDYLPSERWYRQFDGKVQADALRVGGDVHGIVGATLSAQATTQGVRRALALYRVLIAKED
jgi:Na+-translocating ferredoxin:NAD+ oxidoreductase RnfG subunit